MAYKPTVWENREVETPRTYNLVDNPDGTTLLVPAEGNVIVEGTPLVAANMNKMEQGIADAHDIAQAAFQSASDGKQQIATAITGKGVPASGNDTFPQLATKISQITTDPSIGTTDAVAADMRQGKKAISQGKLIIGTIPSKAAQTYTPGASAQTIAANQFLSGVQTIAAVPVPAAKVLNDTTIAGTKGTIPMKAAQTYTPTTANQTIAAGQYLNAAQTIAGSAALIGANIKKGANIFGVAGTYEVVPKSVQTTSVTGSVDSTAKSGTFNITVARPAGITAIHSIIVGPFDATSRGESTTYTRQNGVLLAFDNVAKKAIYSYVGLIGGRAAVELKITALTLNSTQIVLTVSWVADANSVRFFLDPYTREYGEKTNALIVYT